MTKKDFEPNRLFWDARMALGLSRPAVADIANGQPVMSTCEHEPMNENYIGRIEQGRIGGGMCVERRSALCLTLEVDDPAKIGLIAERRRPTRSAPSRQLGRRPPIDDGRNEGTAENDLVDFASVLEQRGMSNAELTAVELACERIDQGFARMPPDELMSKLRILTQLVSQHLRQPQTLRHHERLVRLAARVAGLRAWACFDINDHHTADRWFEAAVTVAQDAQAWALGAWLLGAQSLIPWHRRDIRRAAELIERGVYFASQGSEATTRAWLLALQARAYAGRGDIDGFESSYALAEEAAEVSNERDRRHGMDFAHGTLDLRYYGGTGWLLLRQQEHARTELTGSLNALPESHSKARAMLTLLLADAAVQSDDLAEAEALTLYALTSTIQQPIVPILQQGRRIQRLVHQRDPASTAALNEAVQRFSAALTTVATKARL
ncbi:hypothetical protein [Paractinoplanes rishiriensis]|uniref:hypothetical protein n=1 Tax=Paractinoplanes rishiriensis TaxID=1050105 RepID=UPI00194518EE|nr:hypothetical protein [Actinoplanes rishiriensis]